MRDLAEIFAALFAALWNALTWLPRVVNALAFPPDAADQFDAGTERLRAAVAALDAEEYAERPLPKCSLATTARRFLNRDIGLKDLDHLPVPMRVWLLAAKHQAIDVDHLSNEDLEMHLRGEAEAEGLPPVLDAEKLAQVDLGYRTACRPVRRAPDYPQPRFVDDESLDVDYEVARAF